MQMDPNAKRDTLRPEIRTSMLMERHKAIINNDYNTQLALKVRLNVGLPTDSCGEGTLYETSPKDFEQKVLNTLTMYLELIEIIKVKNRPEEFEITSLTNQ